MYWLVQASRALNITTHKKEYPKVPPAMATEAMVAGPAATALTTQAGPNRLTRPVGPLVVGHFVHTLFMVYPPWL
jgi:hypothetical protein